MSVLVACIGNIFQGDDAFGCEVAKALFARGQVAAGARVVDFGIRGLDLTYALLDAPELTILVDAVSRGCAPGTLYTIEPEREEWEAAAVEEAAVDAHAMDPLRVLRAVRAMGGRLQRVLLVGCEPGDLGGEEGRMGLTEPVSASIEEAARMVEGLVAREVGKQLQEA